MKSLLSAILVLSTAPAFANTYVCKGTYIEKGKQKVVQANVTTKSKAFTLSLYAANEAAGIGNTIPLKLEVANEMFPVTTLVGKLDGRPYDGVLTVATLAIYVNDIGSSPYRASLQVEQTLPRGNAPVVKKYDDLSCDVLPTR